MVLDHMGNCPPAVWAIVEDAVSTLLLPGGVQVLKPPGCPPQHQAGLVLVAKENCFGAGSHACYTRIACIQLSFASCGSMIVADCQLEYNERERCFSPVHSSSTGL